MSDIGMALSRRASDSRLARRQIAGVMVRARRPAASAPSTKYIAASIKAWSLRRAEEQDGYRLARKPTRVAPLYLDRVNP